MLFGYRTESLTYFFINFFGATCSQQGVGEVGMHTGTVPVAFNRFWVVLNIVSVALGQSLQHITSYPNLITCFFGSFGEQLEFPLSCSHLLVDALELQSSIQTKIGMLFNKISSPGVSTTNGTIVKSMRPKITTNGES